MAACVLVVDDSPTIRKVVSAILERRGYTTRTAADGQAALEVLSEGPSIDLVLLDFVMPRMNGFQFCRSVRSDSQLASLPVVLMSAKSDRIRDQFVQQTGALDAISKPFDAEALVAVVENALRRVETGRASASRMPVAAEADDDFVAEPGSVAPRGTPALSGDMSIIPMGAVLQMLQLEGQSGVLCATHGKIVVTVSLRGGLIDLAQSKGTRDEFRLGRYFVEQDIVTYRDIDDILAQPPPSAREPAGLGVRVVAEPADDDDPPPPALSSATLDLHSAKTREAETADRSPRLPGDSAPFPGVPKAPAVPKNMEVRGHFEDAPAFALAERPPDASHLLGYRLLEAGRITEEQLRGALQRQSSELVYEILRWPKGAFEFNRCPAPSLARAARLGLAVASVVMEGFRRVDEWRHLEVTLGDFDGVLVRDPLALESVKVEGLPRVERVVLDAIDGERSIRQIIHATNLSSFDACRVLVQFLEARLVRRRRDAP